MTDQEYSDLNDLNQSYISALGSIRNIVSNGDKRRAIKAIDKIIDGYKKVMELFKKDNAE